ncbi:hypothetical protein KY330_00080 [Candidatus Woesearchaeota archaeon]|nr:hypothetical protein [Candidatus Woesearchaeota archaeon]
MRKLKRWVKVVLLLFLLIILGIVFYEPVELREQVFTGTDYDELIAYTGLTVDEYIGQLENQLSFSSSFFERAETYYIIGKIKRDEKYVKRAYWFYWLYRPDSMEEKAIIYETLASIDKNSDKYYLKAARLWSELGNDYRVRIDRALGEGEDPELELNITGNFEVFGVNESGYKAGKKQLFSNLRIGTTKFEIYPEDTVVVQAERVTRDWLSSQVQDISDNILTVFAERFTYDEDELQSEIGWHEGARISDFMQIGIMPKIATGTIIRNFDGTWYAPDENGVFRFEVSEDKVMYPSNRMLTEDFALVIDTHGISMLVEQALRYNADYVIGCCDYPGKIDAVNYLSERNVSSICFTDRFLYLDLFKDVKAIGSAGYSVEDDRVVIGGREILIDRRDRIIAMDSKGDAQMYYDTASRYFKEIEKHFDLDVEYVTVNGMNQMDKVVEIAEERDADIIAARVFNYDDYKNLKVWLEDGKKVILFHSISYPFGYELIMEYPEQVSFGDIRVEVD